MEVFPAHLFQGTWRSCFQVSSADECINLTWNSHVTVLNTIGENNLKLMQPIDENRAGKSHVSLLLIKGEVVVMNRRPKGE